MPDFLFYATAVGLSLALIAGPLGCFTVWKKMAYFGDTLAHSALLGVSIGLLLEVNIQLAITVGCCMVALMLAALQNKSGLATDTLLGILSHSSLAIGLVCVSLFDHTRIDLSAYLFGDLLSATSEDFFHILGLGAVLLVLLFIYWRPLLSTVVHEELAQVEGLPTPFLRILLLVMIALVIAVGMKVVGVMLITALLILPAAIARKFTQTPETMAIGASLIACAAVLMGLWSSYQFDTPAGPSIVSAAFAFFLLSLLLPITSK